MKISSKGLELIKNFEGCRLTAYKPVAAEVYYTIGYGHYGPDVVKGMAITQEQADKYLRDDVTSFEMIVETTCEYLMPLNQNEFDALVSFTFNCGGGGLLQLTGKKTRTKAQMMEHILAYNKGADGKVLEGLVRRRKAEKELFETPVVDVNGDRFDYLGITAWHKAGFRGKGTKIASRENLSSHGKKVLDILKMVAPEADIVYGKNYTKDIDNNIDIYTTSMFFTSDTYDTNRKKAKALYDSGVMLCCAVGNEGNEDYEKVADDPWWASIGACKLSKGKPVRMLYSSETENLDFCSFTNITTPDGLFTGTSCATPMFAGMMALVKQYFKEKGVILAPEDLYEFARAHSEDMEDKGFDRRTGYGLFRLPSIENVEEEIDMKKYETIEELPDWAVGSIKKAIEKGILKGTGEGLGITETEVKVLCWLDRCGLFDK